MIELFKQQITEDMPVEAKSNKARELLQLVILKIIYDKDFFKNLAFVGGTALRILFVIVNVNNSCLEVFRFGDRNNKDMVLDSSRDVFSVNMVRQND